MGGREPTSIPDDLFEDAMVQLERLGTSARGSWTGAIRKLVQLYFQSDYGYSFDNGMPGNIPVGKSPHRVDDFCSLESFDIENYIDNLLGSIQDVSKNMKAKIATSLLEVPQLLLGAQDNRWKHHKYTNEFQPDEEDSLSGKYAAVHVDVTVVCSNVRQALVIYYLAAYYEVSSEAETKRASFMDEAFIEAKQLIRSTELSRMLQSHCRDEFRKNFGYDYDGNPRRAINPDNVRRSTLWASSHETRFRQVDWVMSLAAPFCAQFGSVPKIIQDFLSKQLSHFVSNISISPDGTWTALKLVVDPTEDHASAFNGYIYYFTQTGTTSQYDVALTYVLIMGVFYETKPPGETDLGDLCDQLIGDLPEQGPVSLHPDLNRKLQTTLEKLTLENAKILFQPVFNFDWGPNPSLPSNEKVCKTFEKYFDLNNDFDTTNIKVAISDLFEPDAIFGKVGAPAVEDLYYGLAKEIKNCINDVTGLNEANQWRVRHVDETFVDNQSHSLRHYALFLFVYGIRGETRQFFLQYLAVIAEKTVS